jgi:hypothetical protein
MGYYATTLATNVTFKEGLDLDGEVLAQVKATLLDPEFFRQHAGGGRLPATGDLMQDKWYSWVSTKELMEATTLAGLINCFVGDADILDGALVFGFDDKVGNEDVLFEVLAPYIDAGGYVEWRGEDGSHWMWMFDGTAMKVLDGEVVYNERD